MMPSGINIKTCPSCAELIKAEATVCQYCGMDLTGDFEQFDGYAYYDPGQGALEPKKLSFGVSLLIILAGFVIFGILSMVFMQLLFEFLQDVVPSFGALYRLNNALSSAILGLGGGLAIGITQKKKIWLWGIAGLFGFGIGSFLASVIGEFATISDPYLATFFMALITAVVIAIAFNLVWKQWDQFHWIILAGTAGFFVRSGFWLIFYEHFFDFYRQSPNIIFQLIGILGVALLGVFYGLVFANPALVKKEQVRIATQQTY